MGYDYGMKADASEIFDHHRQLLAQLPLQNCARWTPVRKAKVVAAVLAGALTFDDASSRYALSLEEFLSWPRTGGADIDRRAARCRRPELRTEHAITAASG